MAEYKRKYPEAPTQEEIEAGYAPSTISGKPFVKFLFWMFIVGLPVTYALVYGVTKGLEFAEDLQNSRFARMNAPRQVAEFTGPPLQPSHGHPSLDTEDMATMRKINRNDARKMGLWKDNPNPNSPGMAAVNEHTLQLAQAAIGKWSEAAASGAPATQPTSERAKPESGKTDAAKADEAKADATKADAAKSEPEKSKSE